MNLIGILEALAKFSWPLQVLFLLVMMFGMHFVTDMVVRVSEHISNVRIYKHRLLSEKQDLIDTSLDKKK